MSPARVLFSLALIGAVLFSSLQVHASKSSKLAQHVIAKYKGSNNLLRVIDLAQDLSQHNPDEVADAILQILDANTDEDCVFGQVNQANVVFVIDCSTSMRTKFTAGDGNVYTRMSYVQKSLVKILNQLKPEQQFGLVQFSDAGNRWKDTMVNATADNIDMATRFVNSLRPSGGTNINDGLSRGFQIKGAGLSAVYLLTDGVPSVGLTDTKQIVDAAKGYSQTHIPNTVINTISFTMGNITQTLGPGYLPEDKEAARELLAKIAEATKGTFRAMSA